MFEQLAARVRVRTKHIAYVRFDLKNQGIRYINNKKLHVCVCVCTRTKKTERDLRAIIHIIRAYCYNRRSRSHYTR